MKKLNLVWLLLFFTGCLSPGSPEFTLNKNVTITTGGHEDAACQCTAGDVTIDIEYSTTSGTDADTKIEGAIKDSLNPVIPVTPF